MSLTRSRVGNLQKAIAQKAIAKQNSKTARRGWQHAIFKPRAAKNTARGDQLVKKRSIAFRATRSARWRPARSRPNVSSSTSMHTGPS